MFIFLKEHNEYRIINAFLSYSVEKLIAYIV